MYGPDQVPELSFAEALHCARYRYLNTGLMRSKKLREQHDRLPPPPVGLAVACCDQARGHGRARTERMLADDVGGGSLRRALAESPKPR